MAKRKVVSVEVNNAVGDALKELINEGQKVVSIDDVLQQHIKAIKEAAKKGNTQKEILERLQSAGLDVGLTKFRKWCSEKGIEFHVGAPKGKRVRRKKQTAVEAVTEQKIEETSANSGQQAVTETVESVRSEDEKLDHSPDLTRAQAYRHAE